METNYTYILKCGDGSYYTGWTNDIEKRIRAHQSGHGAKYTRGRGPVTLVYLETHDTKQEAMRREAAIKRLSRAAKKELIHAGAEQTRRLEPEACRMADAAQPEKKTEGNR